MTNDISILRPKDLDELDQMLIQSPTACTFIAGGTDLLVQKEKWEQATRIVDLTSLPELHQTIEISDTIVRIGAAVPYGKIIRHSQLAKLLPILTYACSQIGAVQIQNRGTLGGNIANASPAGDSLPVLAVLDAKLLIGPRQNGKFKKIKPHELMIGPGQTQLGLNQYIASIEIPLPQEDGEFWAFRKVGQREAMAISKLSLALLGWKKGSRIKQIRIASGSVAPVISRHPKTEAVLNGQELNESIIEKAAETLKQEINPISDIRSTKEYRLQITANILRDILYGWL